MFYKETCFQGSTSGEIPKTWKTGDAKLLDMQKGFPFGSEFFNGNKVGKPLIRIRDVGKTETESYYSGSFDPTYLVKKGDILVSMDGEFSVNLWNGPVGLLNQRVCKISPKEPKILNPLFLYYELQKPLKVIESQIGQTTVKHLLDKDLDKIRIPLPEIEEQRAIVGVLGVVDSAIELADQVIAKTERLKKGLMQQLLTYGIGHTECQNTPIGKMPKEWQAIQLKDVVRSYKNGIYKPSQYAGKGHPCVRMYNIVAGQINLVNAALLEVTDRELEEFGLEAGDVIVNRVNTSELVGKAGVVPASFGKATFESKNIRVRLDMQKILPEFLSVFVQTKEYSNQLLSKAKTAVAQATITQVDLDAIIIPLPPTIDEQREVADIIATIDKKLQLEKDEKIRMERIKRGLMDLLLTGKVRVKVG